MTEFSSNSSLLSLAALISQRLKPVAIYVFGSVASGRANPESDVDLAIFTSEKITFDQSEDIKELALAKWGIALDLIDFVEAPPTLQAEIIRNGKKLLVQNENDLATLIMRALRSYQMLNEEREPILKKRLGAEGWKRLF